MFGYDLLSGPSDAGDLSPMTFTPLHFFAVAITDWMNRQQQDADTGEYLEHANGERQHSGLSHGPVDGT